VNIVLAQATGYSIGQIAILIVVLLAVCGLVLVATRQFGIQIPAWLMQVLGIVVVAFVVIVAIKFVLSM
jgi:hypothetical protein